MNVRRDKSALLSSVWFIENKLRNLGVSLVWINDIALIILAFVQFNYYELLI